MDIDRPERNGTPLNISRSTAPVSNLSDVMSSFRPTKVSSRLEYTPLADLVPSLRRSLTYYALLQLLRREDIKDPRQPPRVLSIDYNDDGELLMTSASDETIQIYNVREGKHEKSLVSKKYGVKLAKFTHTSSSIIYASTKQNSTMSSLPTYSVTLC